MRSFLLWAFVVLLFSPSVAAKGITPRSLNSCDLFSSHEQINDLLDNYATTHPDLVEVFSIGTSVQGRDIRALAISSDSLAPAVRVVGAIHGDECISAQLVIELLDWLLKNYEQDEQATKIINEVQLIFVPLVNPDGYSQEPAERLNAHAVDLNRNFSFAWTGAGQPFSEPETRAIRDLSLDYNFQMGLSYHTVHSFVNAPWNYTPVHPPDEELLENMGDAYAGESGYAVTFGWDWYAIYGDLNDWSLGTRGTFDWTIELRDDLDLELDVHLEGFIAFVEFASIGVKGVITDEQTNQPLQARLTIESDGAPVFNDPLNGDYHRILLPGIYDLTAWSPGYEPLTIQRVEISEEETVELDFQLTKASENVDKFAFAVTEMTLPQEITKQNHPNKTMAWDALGPADDRAYSMSPGGSITVDMGEHTPIIDESGPDLKIVSATQSADPIKVLVAKEQDGPFKEIGKGTQTLELDIEQSQYKEVRFIKIIDTGDGPFNEPAAGYDLDAVVNLSQQTTKLRAGAGCGCQHTGASSYSLAQLLTLFVLHL